MALTRKTGWRAASAMNASSGLIQRNRTGADRRYALVELTTTGRELCHELDAIACTANAQSLTGFAEAEIVQGFRCAR
jgi:DNA-binding MarR family transcriptional regulator